VPHRKPHLPEKTCVVCLRPFAWRKKWEKVWDEVRYCSDACRARRGSAVVTVHPEPSAPQPPRPARRR
jgi:hypothetical protein